MWLHLQQCVRVRCSHSLRFAAVRCLLLYGTCLHMSMLSLHTLAAYHQRSERTCADLVAHGQPALPPYSPGWTYGGDTATVTVEPSPESPPPPPSPSPESPPPPMDSPDAFFNQFEMAGDEGSPDPVPSPPPSPPADPPPSPPSPPPSSPPSPPPPSPPSPSPVRAFRSASDGTDSPPPPTPSPPPPTQSPPPPPPPPAGGETYEGDLTYYGGAGTGGSCTQVRTDTVHAFVCMSFSGFLLHVRLKMQVDHADEWLRLPCLLASHACTVKSEQLTSFQYTRTSRKLLQFQAGRHVAKQIVKQKHKFCIRFSWLC